MNRRDLLHAAAAAAAAATAAMAQVSRAQPARLARVVPRTGERWSAVGLGTWLTFHIDIGNADAMAARREVLRSFFAGGGMLIDSSPMYSTAERVLGELLGDLPGHPPGTTRAGAPLVAASKVWTPLGALGDSQMARSLALWRLPRFDLMQVHNLLAWREHLLTLRRWQDEGRTRLLGIAHELECLTWAALVLKWELAFAAVTCVIPATTRADHVAQNLAAMHGPLPDARQRAALTSLFERLVG